MEENCSVWKFDNRGVVVGSGCGLGDDLEGHPGSALVG
jgi:hypothetical protein